GRQVAHVLHACAAMRQELVFGVEYVPVVGIVQIDRMAIGTAPNAFHTPASCRMLKFGARSEDQSTLPGAISCSPANRRMCMREGWCGSLRIFGTIFFFVMEGGPVQVGLRMTWLTALVSCEASWPRFPATTLDLRSPLPSATASTVAAGI